ncbi:MAG: adenylate kinase [Clostridia bacterium]|nr:adenylate kinase [Clostridia bacterium]
MVYIITGASHTGKTVLAQRLLEKRHIPYLSIDHLKMGLIRSGRTALTPEDDDALTAYLWPVVREIIRTAIENRQELIVEGCYVPFDWRRDFDARYLSSIRFLCLAMTDAYIDARFDAIKAHASDVEARLDDSDLTPDRLKADNRAVIEGFRRTGEPVALIETDWQTAVETLLQTL